MTNWRSLQRRWNIYSFVQRFAHVSGTVGIKSVHSCGEQNPISPASGFCGATFNPAALRVKSRGVTGSHLPPPLIKSAWRLYKILLRVSLWGVLGLGLAAEGEVRSVFLLDGFHFLVPIRLFSPVEESGGYCQTSHHHKDHHGDDAYGTEDSGFLSLKTLKSKKQDNLALASASLS